MSTLTTVVNAALLAVKNKAAIHYTQDSPARWEGIHDKLIAAKGQYPHYADCSSFATWCLWQVLGGGPDIVNGTDWKSGWTGTLAKHGHVVSASAAQPGDLVFYGEPIYHVAMVIGRQNGVLIVASHGEESGPYIVKYNQWSVNSIRRYLPVPTPAPAPKPPTVIPTPVQEDIMIIQFPDCPKAPHAVYATAGESLTWLTPTDYAGLGKPKVSEIKPHATSNLYKLAATAGTTDPRT